MNAFISIIKIPIQNLARLKVDSQKNAQKGMGELCAGSLNLDASK